MIMDNSKYTFHLIHHSINTSNQTSNSNNTSSGDEAQAASNAVNSNQSNISGVSSGQSNEIDSYEQKLFEISDQISLNGHSQASVLSNLNIEQAVVSNTHIAFLLDNGRACRVSYQFNNNCTSNTPAASQSNMDTSNTNDLSTSNNTNLTSRSAKHSKLSSNISSTANVISNSSNSSAPINSSSASYRQSSSSASSRTLSSSSFVAAAAAVAAAATNNSSSSNVNSSGSNLVNASNLSNSNVNNAILRANEAFIIPSPHDILSSSSLSHTFGRGRRSQLLRGRVSNLIVGSSRIPPFVPASAVPESLIESVQTVLQSKSRSVIVRELQRTNLDVNLAVNNLLQRDDEGDDPTDDEDPYMHGDINSHHGESVLLEADGALFDEDSFRLSRRLGNSRNHSSSANNNNSNSNINTNNNTGNSIINSNNASTDSVERDNRKSSYRIRDQRWYDSYRDELFSSSHHHHHHHRSSINSNTSTAEQLNSSSNSSTLNESKSEDSCNKKSSSVSTSSNNVSSNKSENAQPPFSFGENIQYWTDKNNEPIRFTKIAGMYSELVGISLDGRLYQWKWSSEQPFSVSINLSSISFNETQLLSNNQVIINHPKTIFLQLINEKICGISTSSMRASCWTESGKIAAWLDESVDIPATTKYQTPAYNFFQTASTDPNIPPTTEKILNMSTSNLFTIIQMVSGAIYWWGIMPFEQRVKIIDKYHSKSQKLKSTNLANEITVGSYVSLKSLPLYNIGTIGVIVKEGQPKIGQLSEHVFALRDCKSFKFKIKTPENFKDSVLNITEMPPPPSPSKNDCTAQSLNIQQSQPLTGSLKRKKQYTTNDMQTTLGEDKKPKLVELYDEESWNLNDVVLVEDSKSTVLGKAIKVDNDYVLVKMQTKPNDSMSLTNPETDLLENSRIFLKNQLQLIKQSSSAKLPDFMQKTPKKVSDFGTVLTISAQQSGFHAIISKENALFYIQFDLLSNKIVKEKRFTTSLGSFLGKNPSNISFSTQDDPNFNIMTLIDGNSTFYPLIELSGSNILKEPQWKNLFQIKCFSQSIISQSDNDSQTNSIRHSDPKKLQFVSFFAMRMEQLMSSIFRYDLNRVVKILRQLESELIHNGGSLKRLKRILNERCDGNRNIFHAAVYICAPTSNNDLNSSSHVSSQRTNKFSSGDSAQYSDIYATYGSTPSSSFLTSSSSKSTSLSSSIERPWSTTASSNSIKNSNDLSVRKINITIDSIQTQQQQTSSTEQTVNKLAPDNQSDTAIPTPFWPPLPPNDPALTLKSSNYTQTWSPVKLSVKEKKQNALKILEELLQTPLFQLKATNAIVHSDLNYLCDLLSHKSADGLTPFMYAVSLRAYEAGLILLDTALKMRTNLTQTLLKSSQLNNLSYKRDLLFTNMIFPLGSRTDQSPLFVICSNDTCSFTWTGDNHITQDIFECRTCTLVGNLCCCTECARTCHKGHDCKIKTSSPTAYCDCWEKCKCKSLIAGDQDKRFKLLDKLLSETNLLSASSNRGESLLIYLVQTVGRQIQEQRNYKRHCGSTSNRRSNTNTYSDSGVIGSIGDMPQHDLEPPKFCRRALERIFSDWYSVKQIFLFNNARYQNDSSGSETSVSSDTSSEEDTETNKKKSKINKKKKKSTKQSKLREQIVSSLFANNSLLFDESAYVDAQSGCVDLDKFTYLLIMKCPSDTLNLLVDTIQANLMLKNQDKEDKLETIAVVKRFVRSVTRLFVILCFETSPTNLQLNLNLSNGTNSSKTSPGLNLTSNRSEINTKISINSRLAKFKSLTNNGESTNNGNSNSTTIASLVTISPIAKCEYVLRQFSRYASEELADVAHSLVAPVILGISKPSTFKISILSANSLSASNNVSFNNNTTNSNNETSSSLLADELFNLEPPIQRFYSTAISTALILPTPRSLKTMLTLDQQPVYVSKPEATPQFVNTFESVSKQNDNFTEETMSESSKTTNQDELPGSLRQNVTSMPPPLISNQDSSSSQTALQIFAESDNNSNSSTASNKSNGSTNRARSIASSSKCSSSTLKQRDGTSTNFSNRDSSNSSKSSGSSTSSNNSNDSNHSSSNSNSSTSSSTSNSSDSSSDTNSNDTAITESSASTSNTKRSTMALKNGRSGDSGSNTRIISLSGNRRLANSVNFVDPFSLILLNSRNSSSSIDVNIGDESLSSIQNRSGSNNKLNRGESNLDDLPNNASNKIETSSVSSLTTTVNDSSHPGRSIASYFTDEDDNENDEDDGENDDIDENDDSHDLSTNEEDYEDTIQDHLLDDPEHKVKSNKRKRINKNATAENKNELSIQNNKKKLDEEDVYNEENDEEDDDELEDDDEDDEENDEDVDEEEEEDGLEDDYEIEHYNDDENMETSQDNDLTVATLAKVNETSPKPEAKKKNSKASSKITYNPIVIKSNTVGTGKVAEEKSKRITLSISSQAETPRPIVSNTTATQGHQAKSITLSASALISHNNNSSTNSQTTGTNPASTYSPSSNYQRSINTNSNNNTSRNIVANNSVVGDSSGTHHRRTQSSLVASSSAINSIIQQYNNQHSASNSSGSSLSSAPHNYEQRISIINSMNQPSASNLTSASSLANQPISSNPYHHHQTGTANNSSHHLSLGDYYYAAHNLVNLNNNSSSSNNAIINSGNGMSTNSTFSNLLNSNLIDRNSTHGHQHSHQHHHNHTTNIATNVNVVPTSNSSISGSAPQTEMASSLNTPSSVSLTNNTLARVFSILVKLIRDLLSTIYTERFDQYKQQMSGKLDKKEYKRIVLKYLQKLIRRINKKLDGPWQWLVSLMDSTEAQLRFGASLSASQINDLSTNATQYLRHLEEKALLTNYFNNNGNNNQNNYGYYSSNNLVGPFISSRFGSGIDARRKLNIMQHQHQQFANMHLNQSYQQSGSSTYNVNSFSNNAYYQQQPGQPVLNTVQSQPNPIGSNFGVSRATNPSSNSGTNAEILPSTSNASNSSSILNANQSVNNLASQFASSQIISTRKDFMSYALSLMRSQTNEHRDTLPAIDISLLKHVAYVFDGILFYLNSSLSNSATSSDRPIGLNPFKMVLNRDESDESFDEDTEDDDDLDTAKELKKRTKFNEDSKDYFFINENDSVDEDEYEQSEDQIRSDADENDAVDEEESENEFSSNFYDQTDSETEKFANEIHNTKSNDEANKRNKIKVDVQKKNEKFLIKRPCSRASNFFKRSNSTLCLGAESPDPFAYSLEESLPLASKPHLLQPYSRIQDMFKVKSNNVAQFISLKNIGLMSYNLRNKTPILKGPYLFNQNKLEKTEQTLNKDSDVKSKNVDSSQKSNKSSRKKSSKFLNQFEKRLLKLSYLNDQYLKEASQSFVSRPNNLVDRWRLTVDLFGRVFCDDVGLESGSIIRQLGGFQLKEAKFRREMERLRNIATRELLMEVERDRSHLLHTTFKSLNNMYNLQYTRRAAAAANIGCGSGTSSSASSLLPPPLCLNRIKVTFKDEQGEGSGVARSFYTAFAEAILSDSKLPSFENSTTLTSSTSQNTNVSYVPFNMLQRYRNSTRAASQAELMVSSHRRSSGTSSYSAIPVSTNSILTRSSMRTRDQLLFINSAVSYASPSSTPSILPVSSAAITGSQLSSETNESSQDNTETNTTSPPLSINSPPFFSPLIAITSSALNDLPNFDLSFYNSLDIQHREYGQQLFAKISSLLSQSQQSIPVNTFKAAKITGMLLDLRSNQIQQLLTSETYLKSQFDEACTLLVSSSNTTNQSSEIFSNDSSIVDDSPLFWQPDKTMAGSGFYSPRAGLNSTNRLNAFRNVGRIMAICLLQNELCPITLSRHVIKYILGRPIKWHDLAFFDSQIYESLRKMIYDAEKHMVTAISKAKETSKVESKSKIRSALITSIIELNEQIFKPLDLTFNIDLPKEEDGTNNDLIENGSKIEVNAINMYDYVKRYAEFRLVTHVEMSLQEMKSGIFDVLPANALEGLTAEDFRLLLNGVADINIHTLASYTTISDESKETSRRANFEKWFWSTLEKLNQQEKQELLFFWTGSPYLPASEEGFQPLPTITLRPPSDQHLPTANTCINRLYIPMYSSKSILKSKILQAIKTKTFGFV